MHFDITIEKGLVNPKVKQYHKFKSIELDAFKNDLEECFANKVHDKNGLDGMLVAYSEGIKGVVDKHAPLTRCRVPDKSQKTLVYRWDRPGKANQMRN